MPTTDLKIKISSAIQLFSTGSFYENSIALFETLGYSSDRRLRIDPNTFEGFAEFYPKLKEINQTKALTANWLSVELLFQLTGEDIKQKSQGRLSFDDSHVDDQIIESYLFLAIELTHQEYSRSKLADITREVNKAFAMPAMILFKYRELLTLSIINRRINKTDQSRDVLEKVTLIKGINIKTPNRAHIEVLFDLSLQELEQNKHPKNFIELHNAWQDTLNISELNKKFYREISDWYFYAVEHVKYPEGNIKDEKTRNATSVIRLITRLIFVWFIKEKGLVPDLLFDHEHLKNILNFTDPKGSTYYKAILQNLFFATLNTEMGSNRRFRRENSNPNGLDPDYGISTVYRYKEYFKDSDQALALFAGIPFLNGGLFECLDKREENLLVDGFSKTPKNQPVVPDSLFFGSGQVVDMSGIYGDKQHSKEIVRGLINIFNSYKFTIEENTPIEEEIALDPELLGRVFENLLAAYNPETGATARKQTGSFYTPREIVNYMVDESLFAYLQNYFQMNGNSQVNSTELETKLRHLLAYNNEPPQFSEQQQDQLISAINKVKVLDPACGSGAFPMGALHKLVFILSKVDPGNEKWKQRQIEDAQAITDPTARDQAIEAIEKNFAGNELDYGRKLYLIQNSIFGVDIQPIAVQIAKLRFFISLVVDQNVDRTKPNLNILALPNLESKFVAANTLIGIDKPLQMTFENPVIKEKKDQLAKVRDLLFTARTPITKRKYREQDKQLRSEISELLILDGWSNETSNKLATWDPFDQNTSSLFFDSEWMFGVSCGFDIIIGNPPYVDHKKLKFYTNIFKEQYCTYSGTADLYVYFYERSLRFLNSSTGNLALITSNKFLKTSYGAPLRKLLSQYGVNKIVDFTSVPVFEALVAGVILFVSSSRSLGGNVQVTFVDERLKDLTQLHEFIEKNNFNLNQDRCFRGRDIWLLENVEKIQLKDTIDKRCVKIREIESIKIYRGITTGCNEAFLADLTTIKNYGLMDNTNSSLVKKMLQGRNIRKWTYFDSNKYLIFTRQGINIDNYPEIKNYLNKFRERLEPGSGRKPGDYKWYEIQDNTAYYQEFERDEKIIWGLTADKWAFAYDNQQHYLPSNGYILTSHVISTKYLLALLNSKLMEFYFSLIGIMTAGGAYTLKHETIQEFPYIEANAQQEEKIVRLVESILDAKHKDPLIDTSEYELIIDNLVYQLYGLSSGEIAIVEGKPND